MKKHQRENTIQAFSKRVVKHLGCAVPPAFTLRQRSEIESVSTPIARST